MIKNKLKLTKITSYQSRCFLPDITIIGPPKLKNKNLEKENKKKNNSQFVIKKIYILKKNKAFSFINSKSTLHEVDLKNCQVNQSKNNKVFIFVDEDFNGEFINFEKSVKDNIYATMKALIKQKRYTSSNNNDKLIKFLEEQTDQKKCALYLPQQENEYFSIREKSIYPHYPIKKTLDHYPIHDDKISIQIQINNTQLKETKAKKLIYPIIEDNHLSNEKNEKLDAQEKLDEIILNLNKLAQSLNIEGLAKEDESFANITADFTKSQNKTELKLITGNENKLEQISKSENKTEITINESKSYNTDVNVSKANVTETKLSKEGIKQCEYLISKYKKRPGFKYFIFFKEAKDLELQKITNKLQSPINEIEKTVENSRTILSKRRSLSKFLHFNKAPAAGNELCDSLITIINTGKLLISI